MDRTAWLHGWGRLYPEHGGVSVLMGTGTYCVGCGRDQGVICVVIEDDWEPPGPEPDWPFPQDACPVCWLREHWNPPDPWPRGKPRPLP